MISDKLVRGALFMLGHIYSLKQIFLTFHFKVILWLEMKISRIHSTSFLQRAAFFVMCYKLIGSFLAAGHITLYKNSSRI